MALISCPECRREVSDKAPACPGCGYPIAASAQPSGGLRGDHVADMTKTAGKVAGIWLAAGAAPWIARLIVGVVAVIALFAYLAYSGHR